MKKFYFIILFALVMPSSITIAQDDEGDDNGMSYNWGKNDALYLDIFGSGSSYFDFNFFSGPDVENFRTTLKGFGSMGNTYEMSVLEAGGKNFGAFINLGASIRYYRFEEDLKLTRTDENVTSEIVTDQPYEFKNNFFGWSKNKMVIGYLTIPVGFDIRLGFVDIRLQASYNRYLSGKLKLKYKDPDDAFTDNSTITFDGLVARENEKYKVGDDDFGKYHLNKNNFSVSAMLTPVKAGERMFRVGFKYDILPLFEEGKGPEIHETAVIFCFGLSK